MLYQDKVSGVFLQFNDLSLVNALSVRDIILNDRSDKSGKYTRYIIPENEFYVSMRLENTNL